MIVYKHDHVVVCKQWKISVYEHEIFCVNKHQKNKTHIQNPQISIKKRIAVWMWWIISTILMGKKTKLFICPQFLVFINVYTLFAVFVFINTKNMKLINNFVYKVP